MVFSRVPLFKRPWQGAVHHPDAVIGGLQGGLWEPSADNCSLAYSTRGPRSILLFCQEPWLSRSWGPHRHSNSASFDPLALNFSVRQSSEGYNRNCLLVNCLELRGERVSHECEMLFLAQDGKLNGNSPVESTNTEPFVICQLLSTNRHRPIFRHIASQSKGWRRGR